MEVEMVEMTEELLGEVSEAAVKVAGEAEDSEEERAGAAVKVAGEAEDSEEERAGAVVKAEAGEATVEALKARAKPNVFSRLAASKPPLHHISTKNLSPLRCL